VYLKLPNIFTCSGTTVVVNVTLEREDEIAGPILAPFFPQVTSPVYSIVKFTAVYIGQKCSFT